MKQKDTLPRVLEREEALQVVSGEVAAHSNSAIVVVSSLVRPLIRYHTVDGGNPAPVDK